MPASATTKVGGELESNCIGRRFRDPRKHITLDRRRAKLNLHLVQAITELYASV